MGADAMKCIVVVTGPSGAGKSTIGKQLADALAWRFIEGDDLHPAANVEKMRAGIPLSDEDRAPWLDALRERISHQLAADEPTVIACSALKRAYRQRLRVDPRAVHFVHLAADYQLLRERIRARKGHFMKAGMLKSQLATLEPPESALTVDASRPVADIVSELRERFRPDSRQQPSS
jgi:gluconokinase